MSIVLLKTLIAIADRGSFRAAAEATNVSQAAVGQQMQRLERTLNITLFDRSQKTPQLNPIAKALLPKARDVVQAYETLLDGLTDESQVQGELTLGAVPSVIRAMVPLSIKELMQVYPHLQVRVVPGLSSDLQEQIERGAIDCAIVSEPGNLASHFVWEPFVREKLVLLTATEVMETDPMEILRNMPFIRHTRRAAVGLLVDNWLTRHKVSVNTSMELESIESLTSMVSHNLGVSIVPELSVQDPIFASLRKLALPEPQMFRILGVLSRSNNSKIRLVNKLVEQLVLTVQRQSVAGDGAP